MSRLVTTILNVMCGLRSRFEPECIASSQGKVAGREVCADLTIKDENEFLLLRVEVRSRGSPTWGDNFVMNHELIEFKKLRDGSVQRKFLPGHGGLKLPVRQIGEVDFHRVTK